MQKNNNEMLTATKTVILFESFVEKHTCMCVHYGEVIQMLYCGAIHLG